MYIYNNNMIIRVPDFSFHPYYCTLNTEHTIYIVLNYYQKCDKNNNLLIIDVYS